MSGPDLCDTAQASGAPGRSHGQARSSSPPDSPESTHLAKDDRVLAFQEATDRLYGAHVFVALGEVVEQITHGHNAELRERLLVVEVNAKVCFEGVGGTHVYIVAESKSSVP